MSNYIGVNADDPFFNVHRMIFKLTGSSDFFNDGSKADFYQTYSHSDFIETFLL